MSGQDTIECFNSELDAVLSGVGVISATDPAALELSIRLGRADFSAASKLRGPLRARLLARAGTAPAAEPARPFAAHFRVLLPAAFAAACLLLVLVPALRRNAPLPGPGAAPAVPAPAAAVALPAVTARPEAAARPAVVSRAVTASARETGAVAALFGSVPMASLSGGGGAREFPIRTHKGVYPIVTLKGRETTEPSGAAVTWETEDAVFRLERRVITPEELFEMKTM